MTKNASGMVPIESTHPVVRKEEAADNIWDNFIPLLAIVLFSIVLRWEIALIPLERDEGEYAYIASRWLEGDVPYRDAFDQKTPGVFAAYAALFAVGFRSVQAIHWLGHSALAGTIVVLFLLARRMFSPQVGWVAGLFTVLFCMSANVLGSAANTEVFAILPMTAGAYFAWRVGERGSWTDGLLCGLCGGLALSIKQVTLPVVIFTIIWSLYYRGRVAAAVRGGESGGAVPAGGSARTSLPGLAGSIVIGLSLILLPMCLYFALNGAWDAFIDSVAVHNVRYATRVPLQYYGSNFWDATKFLYVVFAPVFAAAIYALYVFYRQGGSAVRFSLWWLFASFLATSAGGYYREHYLILLMPALSLIAAVGVADLAARLEPRRQSSQRWIALAIGVVAILWPLFVHRNYFWPESIEYVCRQLYERNPFPESKEIGRLLRENSDPSDRVFICGSEPQILFHADRASAVRYPFIYPLFAGSDALSRQKAVMEQLRREPPKFILLLDPNVVPSSYLMGANSPQYLFDELVALVQERYRPFAVSTLMPDASTRIIRPQGDVDIISNFQLASGEAVTIRIFERRSDLMEVGPARGEGAMEQQGVLEQNLDEVRGRMERAAGAAGRRLEQIRLVAVTKTVDIPAVSTLAALGVVDFGESRPQELWRKHDALPGNVRWHLVGSLQKNKARRTLPITHLIHSVDRLDLLMRLDELAAELDLRPAVLLEVNVSGEESKHGFAPGELGPAIEACSRLSRVEVRGLMTMAPQSEQPPQVRPVFAALRKLLEESTANAPPQCPLTELSMGMSDDFEAAIEEGATIVRIGSALFRGYEGRS